MATKSADKNSHSIILPVKIQSYSNIGYQIKEYRKTNKITQKQFAKLIHVSEPTVRGWEQNKFLPSYEKYKLIKKLII